MSSLTVYAPQITILDNAVKVINGLFCLNDLHKASGGEKKHQPSFFMRNQETTDLINEIKLLDNLEDADVMQRVNGGDMRGTYVCKDLVYRYAMWISPKFALLVIRTFDKLITGELRVQPKGQLSTEQTLPLRNAVNLLVTKSSILYPDAYKMVHQRFAVKHIKELTDEQLDNAIEYVHALIINMTVKETPLTEFTHSQYITDVKNDAMDYVYRLQNTIVANGLKLPKYPEFDKEEVCRRFIVGMIRHSRMMLSFNSSGEPAIKFVPEQHAVVSRENIADVVQFADKSQLPNIINEAVRRLGQ